MSKKIFNINSSLYPETIIHEAINEFHGYMISYADGCITIDDEDPQLIFDELMNYILSIFSEHTLGA